MSSPDEKVIQYLNEARASELSLVTVLRSQIAVTPRGTYRTALEKHLDETRGHVEKLQRRLSELGQRGLSVRGAIGFGEALVGQALAVGKTPLDLIRGSGGEEKVLKNAKDAAATEALEVATYTALERLATEVGDETTAKLAASIRGEEERMLARIMREIPKLTDAVVSADIKGNGVYDARTTGAADVGRRTAKSVKRTASRTTAQAKRSASRTATKSKRTAGRATSEAKQTARTARKVPGVAQLEGQAKGAVASASDLAIARYDALTVDEIVARLPGLSQIELAKVDGYERRHDNRTTVLSRITSLRGREPWPGYDELSVSEVAAVLAKADEGRVKETASYERSHKNRAGVIEIAERETATA